MSVEQLEAAVAALGPLVSEFTFVGGASIHVWITERAAPPVRATFDVDVICEVASRADYYRLEARLRDRGLTQPIDADVICRWVSLDHNVTLDVMPADESVLGFSNPWFDSAIENASEITLPSGERVKVARPTELVAMKLQAWKGRGHGDLLRSFDVHDVLTLIDGRPELIDELNAASPKLRDYVRVQLRDLMSESYFVYAVESATAAYGPVSAARAEIVGGRVAEIADR